MAFRGAHPLVVCTLLVIAVHIVNAETDGDRAVDPRCIRGPLPDLYALEKKIIKNVIPVITEVPTNTTQFYEDYIVPNKPLVIRGIVDKWPAFKKWNDKYLSSKIGRMRVSVEMSRSNKFGYEVPGDDWRERELTMAKFMQLYAKPDRKVNYYISNDVPEELFTDMDIPEFIPCPNNLKTGYEAPFYTDLGMWFGGGGQVSLLHNDPEDNLLMIVDGRKQLYIFPPEAGPDLYEKTPGFNGLPSLRDYLEDEKDGLEPSSRVSPVDITNPDYEKFPKLRNAQGIELVLEAGDVLFLPKFWWHQVHSYCRNLAVNYWFDLHNLRKSIRAEKEFLVMPSHKIVERLSKKRTSCPRFERERKAAASKNTVKTEL